MNLGFARLRFYAVGLVHLGLLEAGPCGAGDRTIDGGIDWGIDLVQRRLVGVLRLGDCRDVLRRGSRRSVRTAAVAVLVTPTAVAAAATVPTRLVVALVLQWDRPLVHPEPGPPKNQSADEPRRNRRSGRNRGRGDEDSNGGGSHAASAPSPKDVAAVAKPENADKPPLDDVDAPVDAPVDGPVAGSARSGLEQPELDQPDGVKPKASEPEVHSPQTDPGSAAGSSRAEPKSVPQRKRSARREQGPASTTPSDESNATTVLDSGDSGDQAAPAPPFQAETTPAAPVRDPEPAPAPAPRVVTSTRRRSAARPAGPPTGGNGAQPSGAVTGVDTAVSGQVVLDDENADPPQAHVPVKRRGSRRH